MDADVAGWIDSARQASQSGAVDDARACYQKAAYGFNRLSADEREELKQEKDYERKSLDPQTKRFVAEVCEKMESDFKQKFGKEP